MPLRLRIQGYKKPLVYGNNLNKLNNNHNDFIIKMDKKKPPPVPKFKT